MGEADGKRINRWNSLRCSALKGGRNSTAILFLKSLCDSEKSYKFSLMGLLDRFMVLRIGAFLLEVVQVQSRIVH